VTGTHRSPRDFVGYAQLEALNVILVPGVALWFGWPRTVAEAVVLGVAILAAAGFLVIGTLYWRGLAARLRGGGSAAMTTALRVADRWERPLIVVTALASVLLAVGIVAAGWTGAVIASAALTALAWLEYVNYYHWQLQHFDRMADTRRLLAGRGMRRSHMARDLARYRVGRHCIQNQAPPRQRSD